MARASSASISRPRRLLKLFSYVASYTNLKCAYNGGALAFLAFSRSASGVALRPCRRPR
jgi:hypothetical protein